MSVGEALTLANRCRAEGRQLEAELLCRQVLEAPQNSPKSEHLLGLVVHQNGELSEASIPGLGIMLLMRATSPRAGTSVSGWYGRRSSQYDVTPRALSVSAGSL